MDTKIQCPLNGEEPNSSDSIRREFTFLPFCRRVDSCVVELTSLSLTHSSHAYHQAMLRIAWSPRNISSIAARRLRPAVLSRYISEDAKRELTQTLLAKTPIFYRDTWTEKKDSQLKTAIRGFLPPSDSFITVKTRHRAHETGLWPGIHLIYFSSQLPTLKLLPDGTDYGLTPGEPWSQRLWAGGRIQFPLHSGGNLDKTHPNHVLVDYVRDVRITGLEGQEKIFVKTERRVARREGARKEHAIKQARALWRDSEDDTSGALIVETRDLCFFQPKENPAPFERRKIVPPTDPEYSHSLTPTPALLFRYSALTFNAHAIHLDPEYTRNVYGLPNLVVHGPLCLTLMLDYMRRVLLAIPERRYGYVPVITEINYRNLAPLFVSEEMTLCLKRKRAGKLAEPTLSAKNSASSSAIDIMKGFATPPSGEVDSVVILNNEASAPEQISSSAAPPQSETALDKENFPQEWEVWIQTGKGDTASLAVRGTIRVEESKLTPQEAGKQPGESSKAPKSELGNSDVKITRVSEHPSVFRPLLGKKTEPQKRDKGLVDNSGRLTKKGVEALEKATGMIEKVEKISATEVRDMPELQMGTNESPGVQIMKVRGRDGKPNEYNPLKNAPPSFSLARGSTMDAAGERNSTLEKAKGTERMVRIRKLNQEIYPRIREQSVVDNFNPLAEARPSILGCPSTTDTVGQTDSALGKAVETKETATIPEIDQVSSNDQNTKAVSEPRIIKHLSGEIVTGVRIIKHLYGDELGQLPLAKHTYEPRKPLFRKHDYGDVASRFIEKRRMRALRTEAARMRMQHRVRKPGVERKILGKQPLIRKPLARKRLLVRKIRPEMANRAAIQPPTRQNPLRRPQIRRKLSKLSIRRVENLSFEELVSQAKQLKRLASEEVSPGVRVRMVESRPAELIARAKELDSQNPGKGAFERTLRALLDGY